MASEKYERDAKRMKSRGFSGYLMDRLLNRADFEDAPIPVEAAVTDKGFQKKTLKNRLEQADQYAKGGTVKAGRGDGIAKRGKTRGKYI